jgi:hypothetical protein
MVMGRQTAPAAMLSAWSIPALKVHERRALLVHIRFFAVQTVVHLVSMGLAPVIYDL